MLAVGRRNYGTPAKYAFGAGAEQQPVARTLEPGDIAVEVAVGIVGAVLAVVVWLVCWPVLLPVMLVSWLARRVVPGRVDFLSLYAGFFIVVLAVYAGAAVARWPGETWAWVGEYAFEIGILAVGVVLVRRRVALTG